jgi:hypothetical protein
MSGTARPWTDHVPFLRLVNPIGFLKTAATFTVLLSLFHLLGWREYTSFFSGTLPAGGVGSLRMLLGFLYVLAYFAFVLGTPILVLGAAVFTLIVRACRACGKHQTPMNP